MDINSFAPCGLICGLCKEAPAGCRGCRNGGGDQDCYQLTCCRDKAITGCWQCESFPCDKGYFINEEWKGVITGFAKCARDMGPEAFHELVKSKLGESINFEEYLSMSYQKIIDMLRGTNK